PELHTDLTGEGAMLSIDGNDVRITGLRLRGPTRDRWAVFTVRDGIKVKDSKTTIIDHNDLSDWIDASINVYGFHSTAECPAVDAGTVLQPNPTSNVQVLRNFIHHNEAEDVGYGTALSHGGNATIGGNTFLMNRHAITSDGSSLSGYVAWNNLVLSS